MLKITYTEVGQHLEQLTQSLEEWTALRVVLALRTGQALVIEQCTASLLFPAALTELYHLETAVRQEGEAIALSRCDTEYVEVSLQGIWIAADSEASEGVFVATIRHRTEFLIFKLWQESQAQASSLKR